MGGDGVLRFFVGLILILAGSILGGAGMIADAVDTRVQILGIGYLGVVGYVLGGAMLLVGILMVVVSVVNRRDWDDD